MQLEAPAQLKEEVRRFWDRQSCDTQNASGEKFSLEYFQEIERVRYFDQPFIHSFAQFTRYHGKSVLEVGFGAGTDFIQWLRAGARASGIDLTQQALDHLRNRIKIYGLPAPEFLQIADAENLPFESNSFDLGYSFGVLHHSPETQRALAELVRVVRPGGEIKIMLYNRYSIWTINRWVKFALLKGRPWKSLSWVMWNHNESPGTKAYSRPELLKMLGALPLESVHIDTQITSGDYLGASAFRPLNWLYRIAIRLAGWRFAWNPGDYGTRLDAEDPDLKSARERHMRDPKKAVFTGNPLGFYHCIRAQKV
jgi:ubiquinone/menaquinone biosynthesis C-methylase UbiE